MVRVLIVALVQALDALVWVHVDLAKALVALFQAHPHQEGLIWTVSRQVVLGPGAGLIGAV